MAPGSHIVTISTSLNHASGVTPNFLLYCSTKGAIEQMTRVMAKGLASKGISVNCVAPGPVDTDLFHAGTPEPVLRIVKSINPYGRIGNTEEVADALFVNFGWITSIGVFQDYYQTHQLKEYSPSTVAWIPALQAFMMFVGAPFYGKVFDNYGPRHLLFFGTIFHVLGLMMASVSSKYYQFLLSQGVCSPLGSSATFYAAINSGSTWFSKRRALALGIESSGSSLGGVIFP